MQKVVEWRILQAVGEEDPSKVNEDDVITALQFDKTGQYLSLGDNAGRIIIFNTDPPEKGKVMQTPVKEYRYMTEFQSHLKEFDSLKSEEIKERITQIQWLRSQGKNHYLLTTSFKTIKLWKLSAKAEKKAISRNTKPDAPIEDVKFPRLEVVEEGYVPCQQPKRFPALHDYSINSLAVFSTDSNFLSADDLRIYYWDMERINEAYSVIDIKPVDLFEEITEVITSCKAHPTSDMIFGYSTSKGILNVCDMRLPSDKYGKRACQEFSQTVDPATKNFFSDILVSVTDMAFAPNSKYIYARDYLTVKIWDLTMTTKPVSTISIYDPLKTKLVEAYENDYIFDKFSVAVSPCSRICATGMYNNNFHIMDSSGTNNIQFECNLNRLTKCKQIPKKCTDKLVDYDFNARAATMVWHPTTNVVATSVNSNLYVYQAR